MTNDKLRTAMIFVMLTPLACGRQESGSNSTSTNSGLSMTSMRIGSQTFTLEIANTDSARTRGLMRRDSMRADHGMIFVFPDEAPRGFWMRDTRIALDILFLDSTGNVVSIHSMKPYDLNSTHSAGPAKYAIELNLGAAASSGVTVGEVMDIPAEARDVPTR